jgi:hypothetical protein
MYNIKIITKKRDVDLRLNFIPVRKMYLELGSGVIRVLRVQYVHKAYDENQCSRGVFYVFGKEVN